MWDPKDSKSTSANLAAEGKTEECKTVALPRRLNHQEESPQLIFTEVRLLKQRLIRARCHIEIHTEEIARSLADSQNSFKIFEYCMYQS